MRTTLALLSIILADSLLLSSCVTNGYREFYHASYSKGEIEKAVRDSMIYVLRRHETPVLIESSDLQKDDYTAQSLGFVRVGYSSFNGPFEGYGGAVEQANQIDAVVVIASIGNESIKTGTYYVPVETETTSTTEGNIKNKRFTATTTTKGTTNQAINYRVSRYDHIAYYYVKKNIEKVKLGVIARDLTNEDKIKIQRNTGAAVYVVIQDTPAFFANVLFGDTIVELNGQPILSVADLYSKIDILDTSLGKATIKVLRNNEEKVITINFKQP